MLAPIIFALALIAGVQVPQEVLAEIRIHGNLITPDDEVRQLAGLQVGMAIASDTPARVAARLNRGSPLVRAAGTQGWCENYPDSVASLVRYPSVS